MLLHTSANTAQKTKCQALGVSFVAGTLFEISPV